MTSPITTPVAILLAELVDDAADACFEAAGFSSDRLPTAPGPQELIRELQGVRILGIRSRTQITEEILANAPDLEAIGCFCIGTNQVDIDAAARHGVAVFNAPFSNTRSVAELTIAEIIALHRRLFERSSQMHAGSWVKTASSSHEVRGRVLGIVGYGHIGSQVSILAEAMGMRVIYFDVASKLPLGNAEPVSSLTDLLHRADVVTIHVPDTPRTRGMMGHHELASMKPGAFLINNARGHVVDLDSLGDSIERSHIGGAAVDVYPSEPSSGRGAFECVLAGLPNVILTPHIGGSTREAQRQIAVEVAEKLTRFLQTGTTTSAVNVPEVDLPQQREGCVRALHFHRNVPGVLSNMNGVLAELKVNINAEYLQTRADLSYVILDVDPTDASELRRRLGEIPETIRVRTIE
jgi:D-3-phosphoglycerate dehydrogenase